MQSRPGENCCPIRERTADGESVGRCWYALDNCECPRHGDVRAAVYRYRDTGKLTDENDLAKPYSNAAKAIADLQSIVKDLLLDTTGSSDRQAQLAHCIANLRETISILERWGEHDK